MIAKLKAFLNVLKKGEQVADPATWKNRTALIAAAVALLWAVKGALALFGVEIDVTEAQVESAIIGLASFLSLSFTVWTTFATSKKVGIGGKKNDAVK
jgi:glycerol-3-phosphate acyltransferase PlsY